MLTAAEVSQARIGDEPIPTMADLLEAFPDARFNIDVEEPNAIGPLTELLRSADAVERVCISSFSDTRLTAMREAFGPELCTSAGPREAFRLWRASRKLKAGEMPGLLSRRFRAWRRPVCRCRRGWGGSWWSTSGCWPPPTPPGCRCTCGP